MICGTVCLLYYKQTNMLSFNTRASDLFSLLIPHFEFLFFYLRIQIEGVWQQTDAHTLTGCRHFHMSVISLSQSVVLYLWVCVCACVASEGEHTLMTSSSSLIALICWSSWSALCCLIHTRAPRPPWDAYSNTKKKKSEEKERREKKKRDCGFTESGRTVGDRVGGHTLRSELMVKVCVTVWLCVCVCVWQRVVSRNLQEISCPVKFLVYYWNTQRSVCSRYGDTNKLWTNEGKKKKKKPSWE